MYDFMNGHCHLFAILKNRELKNDQFLLLLDRTEEYSPGIYAVNHVYVLTKEKTLIDFHGVSNADDVISQFMEADDFNLESVIEDSEGDVEDITGNMHLNDFGGIVDPIILIIEGEDNLQNYVAKSLDDWSRPLEYYDEETLKEANNYLIKIQKKPKQLEL